MKRMRVIATKIRIENQFKTYYHWDNQPISEIVDRWVNNDEQLYDKRVHGDYPIDQILPYREYEWVKEDARLSPEEWDGLKNSLRTEGWKENDPVILMIGKNGIAKVGEGNHRLAIAQELIEEEGLINLTQVPVTFVFQTNVQTNEGWKTPSEREIMQQKYNEEQDNEKYKESEYTEHPKQINNISEEKINELLDLFKK
jgi:hypothetical protein